MNKTQFTILQNAWKSVTHASMSDERFFHWWDMMLRCYLPTHPYFEGVQVAPEWHDVAIFYRDMGPMPKRAMRKGTN